MAPKRDPAKYENEKKILIQHYLFKMLHQILKAVDTNSQSEVFAAIISMVDWSQAFDRQCHILGVQSFIDNGVRSSLIPILINHFQNRRMTVKWNGCTSSTQSLNGGGTQGGLLGILEYLSQNNDCASFLTEDEKFKYIDDLSILEFINLISIGIASYNCKLQVPNDIGTEKNFIPTVNLKTQNYLNEIQSCTEQETEGLYLKKQIHDYQLYSELQVQY
jgi:hypothetical protein